MSKGALSGVRVLDLGIITAGAATSAMLADLGADVIKIESPTYADPFRQWAGSSGASPFFRATNRNKRGLGLDLKRPGARALFLDLVQNADIVVENFRRGVLEGLGLDYPTLAERNPGIILASISSQGDGGPLANYVSFGTTLEAMSGMAALGGYADGPPAASGHDMNYPDQVVALFASGMIVSALLARQDSGLGAHLDLSQRELTSFLCGDLFAAGMTRETRYREAEDGIHAIQGAFALKNDGWLAVSVPMASQDRLAQWLADRGASDLPHALSEIDAAQATASLHALGIAAEPLVRSDTAGVLARASGSKAIAADPEGFPVKGLAFDLANLPQAIDRSAPDIGQDTVAILRELLALDDASIERLVEQEIIRIKE